MDERRHRSPARVRGTSKGSITKAPDETMATLLRASDDVTQIRAIEARFPGAGVPGRS
jgi:hypothetical protein